MKTLKTKIAIRTYFVVGYGDGYDGKVVKGSQLINHICKLIIGPPQDAAPNDIDEIVDDLNNEDNWSHFNGDMQFGHFKQDIGEIGHIEIWRVTNTP